MFLPYVVSHRLNLTIKITDESQFFFLTVHLIMGSKQTQFCVIIIIRNNVFSWALELQYLKKSMVWIVSTALGFIVKCMCSLMRCIYF